jgi:hypothetical protein
MTTTTIDSLAVPTSVRLATPTWKRRLSWGLTALVSLFLAFDAIAKIALVDEVVKGSAEVGFPLPTLVPIGVILLACVALYVVPRTAVIGAVLLTGYLGGAIATHVRLLHPLPTHTLFPIYFAVVIWGALYLRDARVRALVRAQA